MRVKSCLPDIERTAVKQMAFFNCRHFRGYEEVRTPAVKTAGMNPGERLLPIEEMEPWAQSAFKGFKYANLTDSNSIYRTLHRGLLARSHSDTWHAGPH